MWINGFRQKDSYQKFLQNLFLILQSVFRSHLIDWLIDFIRVDFEVLLVEILIWKKRQFDIFSLASFLKELDTCAIN